MGNDTLVFEINKQGLTMISTMPDRGVTTFRATEIQLTQDGVLFGVIRTVQWEGKNGSTSRQKGRLIPFAFRCQVSEGDLKLTDARFYAFDARAHHVTEGLYEQLKPDLKSAQKKPTAKRSLK